MHEISLIYEVLEQVGRAAEQEGVDKVTVIKLKIGKKMMVLPEALEFAFETLKKEPAAEAELKWEIVEGHAFLIEYIEGEDAFG